MEVWLLSGIFPDPVWEFSGTDIAALAVMGATLGDQDLIAILDAVQRRVPWTAWVRFPLYLAKRIENEVRRMSFGVRRSTSGNTWLSVMTRDGFFFKELSVSVSSDSRQTMGMAPESKRSRITCCCGRIRRPFGAALSTRTTMSSGFTRCFSLPSVETSAPCVLSGRGCRIRS